MVGRYDKLKGQDLFLSAIRHLLRKLKKFLIVFVGRDHKKIESKISEICLSTLKKFQFRCLITWKILTKYYQCLMFSATLFRKVLMPIRRKLMGKPCTASLVGDVEDIIADPFQQVVAGKPSEQENVSFYEHEPQ